MNLLSKILKTKKRLSNNSFLLDFNVICLVIFFYFFVLIFHCVNDRENYGIIPIFIPSFVDSTINQNILSHDIKEEEEEKNIIDKKTTVIEINKNNFSMGNIDQKTKNHSKEKYFVSFSEKNQGAVISKMIAMTNQLKLKKELSNNNVAIIVPCKDCSTELVLTLIHELQKTNTFKNIVLANGYL